MKIPSMTEASEWLLKKILIPKKQEIENLEQVIRDHALRLGLDCVGLLEGNLHNRAPWIDKINKEIGLPMGAPYCLSGIMIKVIKQIAKEYGLKIPFELTGSTQRFWVSAPDRYKRLPDEITKRADIGILQNRKNISTGHGYLVDRDNGTTQDTVEWNTDFKGSSDGEGVHQLKRYRDGTVAQKYLGSVDVIQWMIDFNKGIK